MENKKVAIFIYSLAGGGAERVVSILLNKLNNDFDFYLVLMNNTIKYDLPKDIPIFFIENSNPNENKYLKILKLPFLAYQYSKFLIKHEIDLSLSFLYRPNIINILTKKLFRSESKVIVSERSNILYQPKPIKFLVKFLYKFADLIIPNSIGSGKTLISKFLIDKKKIRTIHNPIQINESREKVRNRKYFSFITVGRLKKVKNYELLIKAFSKIKSTVPVKLYILGEGEEESNLKTLTKRLKIESKVVFTGFVRNTRDYYLQNDCFIMTSKYEGFPNVLVEALSAGLPIISTDCKFGPREILSDTDFEVDSEILEITKEKYGILVPNGNEKLLTEAMEMMIIDNNLRHSYENLAFEKARQFSADIIISQFFEVLNDNYR